VAAPQSESAANMSDLYTQMACLAGQVNTVQIQLAAERDARRAAEAQLPSNIT
jgi:hypothetical protein